MKFDLVIFDLDGVLVDSTEAITSTFRHVLKTVGRVSVTDKQITEMIGMPLHDMFERYLPGHGEECSVMYREIYGSVCVGKSKLYNGVVETLEYLKFPVLAEATTKYSREAEILLKGMAIRK